MIIFLHLHQKLTFNRMSTPQCHEINVMTFDAECHEICFVGRKTNVMTLMSWDLENVMTFIFSGTGPRSRAPGKQFGVLDRWRDRHTRPARWSDTLRIRPVRWRKWNRIRIDLTRLADPIAFISRFGCLHLGQWPMTYLMTLSDWTMSCQPWPPRARYGQWARYK